MSFKPELFDKGLDHVITFGKHTGKTLEQICRDDPKYIDFLKDKVGLKMKKAVFALQLDIEYPTKDPKK